MEAKSSLRRKRLHGEFHDGVDNVAFVLFQSGNGGVAAHVGLRHNQVNVGRGHTVLVATGSRSVAVASSGSVGHSRRSHTGLCLHADVVVRATIETTTLLLLLLTNASSMPPASNALAACAISAPAVFSTTACPKTMYVSAFGLLN